MKIWMEGSVWMIFNILHFGYN